MRAQILKYNKQIGTILYFFPFILGLIGPQSLIYLQFNNTEILNSISITIFVFMLISIIYNKSFNIFDNHFALSILTKNLEVHVKVLNAKIKIDHIEYNEKLTKDDIQVILNDFGLNDDEKELLLLVSNFTNHKVEVIYKNEIYFIPLWIIKHNQLVIF